jgi:LacI family transcriptional regulator
MQANNDTPCVLIDDHAHGELFDSVASDDFSGAMLATNHLINLGHTRIGYVNLGKIANKGRQVRQQGFVASMTAAGFPTDDVLVSEKFDDEQGRAVRTFLDRSDRPTALFCTNDEIAAVAREAARELGIRVPEDLAIAGYGNGILATYGGFTSVQEQAEAMGRAAVRRLLLRRDEPEAECTSTLFETKLFVRASTTMHMWSKGMRSCVNQVSLL